MSKKPLSVGLTGIWGSGKSTVLEMFGRYGARTISADTIVHGLLQNDRIISEIKRLFGAEYVHNGRVDRRALAGLIFSDESAKRTLEGLLHPFVFEEIERFLKTRQTWLNVVEVPLLFETASEHLFDFIVVVKAGHERVMERLTSRGFSEQEVVARLKSQLPEEEKLRRADFVIDNSGTLETTEAEVKRLLSILRQRYENRNN